MAKTQYSVLDTPGVLLIQLERFQRSGKKVTQTMTVPFILRFQGFDFSLVAVINHHGSVESGHYTACINGNNQWFSCNDHSVTSIDSGNVASPHNYLLFYIKPDIS